MPWPNPEESEEGLRDPSHASWWRTMLPAGKLSRGFHSYSPSPTDPRFRLNTHPSSSDDGLTRFNVIHGLSNYHLGVCQLISRRPSNLYQSLPPQVLWRAEYILVLHCNLEDSCQPR